ncbi:MAG: cold shock domain-containing protein [Aeriscardovia sp.]|nr:cold shock domain-containing protein [Aeriscardovia sp.]MBO7717650.1 cold shock domain-containing protein [Aeriscardovia sp.]
MPTGKIRWFDSKKGYGFIAGEDGKEVYFSASNLPSSFTPKSGMKVEYSEIEEAGRMQAFNLHVVQRSVPRRHTSDEMNAIIEDLIKLLDSTNAKLKHGKWPDPLTCNRLAKMLRAVAEDFDIDD